MSTASIIDVTNLPDEVDPRHTSGWWGAVIAVMTEATLFGALLAAYFYLRLHSDRWPQSGIERPALLLGGIGLALLLASSVVVWWAERALRADRPGTARLLIALSIAAGLVFLVLQSIDYRDKHFGVATNAYGTIVYTVTGLHMAHVVAGLLMLSFAWVRIGHRRRPVAERALAIVSLYWHFVDAVWVAVYVSLFLSEHWF